MKKNAKTIGDFQKHIVKVFKAYEKTGTVKWNYDIAAKDLSYQVGSLVKRLMQYRNERFADGLSKAEIKTHIADELSDIMAEVLFIAHELDIDLNKGWEAMIASDTKKIRTRSK